MHSTHRHSFSLFALVFVILGWSLGPGSSIGSVASAQEAAEQTDPLVNKQSSVAARYARLEELLLRLSDVEARENPERAALLKRVSRQSRERFVLEKLRGASDLLASGQLSKAVDDQKVATTELEGLLKLLLSEDRSSRIRDEKKRIAEIIKQLRLTERNERSVRARTENGVELEEVLKEQEEISKRAEQLSDELREDDESENGEKQDGEKQDGEKQDGEKQDGEKQDGEKQDGEKQDGEKQDGEKQDGEKQDGEKQDGEKQDGEKQDGEKQDGEKQDGEKQDGEKQDGEKQDGEKQDGEKQDGEKQDGEKQDGEKSESQPKSPEQEAQSQLEKAIEQMKEAQEKLKEEKRGEATEKQRQAEEELRKAIDKLEKILRQLREEEIQRELAKLESRLRKMAVMQSAVLDATVQLAQTPASQRDRTTDLKAGDLSFEEQKITLEADRAMLLLREEGSSVAFPEVISQLRDDTQRVATRLGQSKIDMVTQGIQNDILAALEEMISAVAKAQRDNEKKQQQQNQEQGQPSGQGSQEEPLVQSLAELKLIRTMQIRIQGTTERYGNLLDVDNGAEVLTTGEEVLPLLRNLAQRQDRLYQITRDLVTKRNR